MKLINEWKRALTISLSFWMQVFGLLVLILPELWYGWTGEDYNPQITWWLGVLLLLAGIIGRVVQQGVSPLREWIRIGGVLVIIGALAFILATNVRAAPASESDTLKIAVPFIAQSESIKTKAYLDIVGVPTICAGSTRGVRLGQTKTMAECLQLLQDEVIEYRTKLHVYFTADTINNRLPATRDAAYTSLAFNVGIVGAGKSTATRRLNAGDIVGGCQALTWFDKAGGRVIRGLFERRKREKALCMMGV